MPSSIDTDLNGVFTISTIEQYKNEVHKEFKLNSITPNISNIVNPVLITNTNPYDNYDYNTETNLNFINLTEKPIKSEIDQHTIYNKIYDGFGAYSTAQGFQQNLPLITFRIGTNRLRSRFLASTKEKPLLVLQITRQYLNTLLQIRETTEDTLDKDVENLGHYFHAINQEDSSETEEGKYTNYISISYKEIRKELLKTALYPSNFGKIPDIEQIKIDSNTPSNIKTYIEDIEHADDEFAQAKHKKIFTIPINLHKKEHNYGQIRVKEVNHLKSLFREYHNNHIKRLFKIDLEFELYNMFIEDDDGLDITEDRMSAILITQGLNLDSDIGINFSDGILELSHLTDLADKEKFSSSEKLNTNTNFLEKLIDNLDTTYNPINQGEDYSIKMYEIDKQILDASIDLDSGIEIVREFKHGFCGGDIIVIPQEQCLKLSTAINGSHPDPNLHLKKNVRIVFEVVDLIDQKTSPDWQQRYQDDLGQSVIDHFKNINEIEQVKVEHLDYSNFRTGHGETGGIIYGIDLDGEPDYDVKDRPQVNENSIKTFYSTEYC